MGRCRSLRSRNVDGARGYTVIRILALVLGAVFLGSLLGVAGAQGNIPGDFNGDGFVDIRDYGVWRANFGATDCGNPADANGDCLVDIRDYAIWRQHFGEGAFRTLTPTPLGAVVTATATRTIGVLGVTATPTRTSTPTPCSSPGQCNHLTRTAEPTRTRTPCPQPNPHC